MSSDLIRAFRDDDIPAVARIWRELRPDAMHSENGLRHLVGSFPERAQAAFWVAEEDVVVAWCFAHRRWHRATDNGYVWLGVLPAARGRGVGTAFWQLADEHLDAIGIARINADVVGDEAGATFWSGAGSRRSARSSSPPSTRAASTATSWPCGGRRPSGPGTGAGDGDRRRARGCGLATLAKLAQLRWAAANGLDQVVTDNDERDAPMLAINRRLGYEPFTGRRGYLKGR